MKSLADISGNNATHQLTTDAQIMATAVYICAVGGPARLGGSTTDSSHGASLETGKMTILPPKFPALPGYRLGGLYAYVPNGTTLTISYDND